MKKIIQAILFPTLFILFFSIKAKSQSTEVSHDQLQKVDITKSIPLKVELVKTSLSENPDMESDVVTVSGLVPQGGKYDNGAINKSLKEWGNKGYELIGSTSYPQSYTTGINSVTIIVLFYKKVK